MADAPSSENATTSEESYAETTPLRHPGATEDAPPKPKPARARKGKAEGQWALGYREPLNANEQFKKDDDALNVRARIENIYAHAGFDSIDPADLRGRLRWWGLYTQRKPGHRRRQDRHARAGGARRQVLHAARPHRRRRADHRAAARHRRDLPRRSPAAPPTSPTGRTSSCTGSAIEDVPEIWARLEAVGLHTTEACGDCPRVVLGSPVAGIAADEIIDPHPGDRGDRRAATSATPSSPTCPASSRPRSPARHPRRRARDQRHLLRRGRAPRAGPGLRPVGRRRAVHQPAARRAPRRLGRRSTRCPTSGPAWCGIFRDYGYRRLRTPGPAEVPARRLGPREVPRRSWRTSTSSARCPTARRPRPRRPRATTSASTSRRTAGSTSASPRRSAGSRATTLLERGRPRRGARLGPGPAHRRTRSSLVLDVEPTRSSRWSRRSTARPPGPPVAVPPAHDGLHRHRVLQARDRRDQGRAAASSIDELEQRLADIRALDVPVTIHVNGCPNSCARIQVADIGLKGQLVPDADGNQVEGYQVHLGGGLGLDAGFGRKVRGHKVTADELARLRRARRAQLRRAAHEAGERFAQWAVRADEGASCA